MDHKLYLSDKGIFKKGSSYYYFKNNKKITDQNIIDRLNSYVVPPAWTNVWYASNKKCHIILYGTDISGKKQYILSDKWINTSRAEKFNRMKLFIKDIPSFKKKIKISNYNEILNKNLLIKLLFNLLIDLHIRV